MDAGSILYRGAAVSYVVQGTGPAIVFLHGWRQRKETWSSLMGYFSRRGYRCIAMDLPGFGQSQLNDVWDVHDYAWAIGYVLRQLHVSHCIVVGHSFGGKCAAAVAAQEPALVSRLVLSSANLSLRSSALSPTPPHQFIRWVLQIGQSKQMRQTFVRTHSTDFGPLLQKIHAPTLVIYGTYDCIAPVAQGRAIANRLPRATLMTLPAWHLAYREHPRRYATALETFFRS